MFYNWNQTMHLMPQKVENSPILQEIHKLQEALDCSEKNKNTNEAIFRKKALTNTARWPI